MAPKKKAVIGLRVKTAKAIALVLRGTARTPQPIHRAELILSSPRIHATAQPYHEVMDLPWEQAQVAVQESALAIENLAIEVLAGFLRDVEARGFSVRNVAIVGAPERRLEAIRNPHIRAHAAEGILYRHVLKIAASGNSLASRVFPEYGLLARAESTLGLSGSEITSCLADLGNRFGRPWRADEKAAAVAAWIALVDHASS
jgi:hypothetical protein